VLYWPSESLLIFSDLHLEKGSFLAQKGHSPLPLYDSRDTLARMEAVIAHYQPQAVLCLGDSLHDASAHQRMNESTLAQLNGMITALQQWHWVLGNHDPEIPSQIKGERHQSFQHHSIHFSHEPEPHHPHQIIGHFHPKMSLRRNGITAKGPCFLHDKTLMIMPSFGSYTGGLDIQHNAIATLFPDASPHKYLIFKDTIRRM
jgi:DNA ligase-associated metallophosphoesterase